MGTGERSFLGGVGSFFAAHVAYITGFASAGSVSSAYGTVLATMYAVSTMLHQDLPRSARRKVVLGTSLFLASDTVLGLRKFLLDDHSPALESVVMATYTAGQWFIADGVAAAA